MFGFDPATNTAVDLGQTSVQVWLLIYAYRKITKNNRTIRKMKRRIRELEDATFQLTPKQRGE